jgi:hypothetical protein
MLSTKFAGSQYAAILARHLFPTISNKLKAVIPTTNYLCKIAFTSPVSVASNERVFSVLKLIKNNLRTTMTDKHLNNLLILNTFKDIFENINMSARIKSGNFKRKPYNCINFVGSRYFK